MNHLRKAEGLNQDRNWVQSLRYSELALEKLKKLNDRPVEDIDDALCCKFTALNFMGHKRESMECAKERYCQYLTSHTHPPAIRASFNLIESCIKNDEYEDAELYARTTWETITLSRDSHIPDNERQQFTARGAYYLARAMLELAQSRDIPSEENQAAGREAIALARRALDIWTQLCGTEDEHVANAMGVLADALEYFNNVDDNEVIRLYEKSNAITARVQGSLTVNVGGGQHNLAIVYHKRAKRAHAANDLDRTLANLELALPLYVDAARIFKAIGGHVDKAEEASKGVADVEKGLQQINRARGVVTRG